MPKYKVLTACALDGRPQTPGTILDLGKGHFSVKSGLHFKQIVEVDDAGNPIAKPLPPTFPSNIIMDANDRIIPDAKPAPVVPVAPAKPAILPQPVRK